MPYRDEAGSTPPESRDDAARAEEYRRQLTAVAENATVALFIMDERQQCTFMNPAAERMTGFRLDEVRGRALHDVIHHTRPDGSPYPLAECPIDRAFPEEMREQGEDVFVHRDGRFYPVAFTASPIRDGGRTVGTVIEVREITEEKRERAERERLLRELETERARPLRGLASGAAGSARNDTSSFGADHSATTAIRAGTAVRSWRGPKRRSPAPSRT